MADKCLAPSLQNSLDANLGALVGILNSVQSIDVSTTQLLNEITQIKTILEHEHKSHLHGKAHDGQENYNVDYGQPFLPIPIVPADKLISEYDSNYDYDSNGLIYGTDFKLIGPNIPRAILEINELIKISKVKFTLTMEQYIATVPNHEKLWGI